MTATKNPPAADALAHKLSFEPQYHTQLTEGAFAGSWTLATLPLCSSFGNTGLQKWMLEAIAERKRLEEEGAATVTFDFKGEIGTNERFAAALQTLSDKP